MKASSSGIPPRIAAREVSVAVTINRLSYTTFEKTEWVREGDSYSQTVTNTGERYGAEVAMLFLDGELRGFKKVRLAPGESVTVTITPDPVDDTEYPDELTIPSETQRRPITLESRFTDLRQTFMGRILFNAVLSVAGKQEKQARRMPDGAEKDNKRKGAMFLRCILESNSLISMSMCAGQSFPLQFCSRVHAPR